MKNRAKRILSFVLAIAMLATLMVGCDQKTGGNEMTTVRVWTHSRSDADVMLPMIEEFNNTTGKEKGITIEYEMYGDDYMDVINTAIKSGQAPELHTYFTDITPVVKSGDLLALEDLPGGQEIVDKYKDMLKPVYNTIDGKTYAVPLSTNTCKMIYNKDLFKKCGIVDENGEATPPKTWAEVIEYAKIITEQSAGEAWGTIFPMKWVNGFFEMEIMYPFYCSIGHEYFNVKTGRYDFSAFAPAFNEYMLKIKADGSYYPDSATTDNDVARALFAEGKIGMKMAISWDVGVLNDQFPAKCDWGVCDLPVMDESATRYKEPIRPSTLYFVNKTANNSDIDKVMEVLNFLQGDEMFAKKYEECLAIPVSEEAKKLATKAPGKAGWVEFADFTNDTAFARCSEPTGSLTLEGPDYNEIMMQIWRGQVSVEDGLKDLDTRYNAALDKAVADGKVDLTTFQDSNYDISVK